MYEKIELRKIYGIQKNLYLCQNWDFAICQQEILNKKLFNAINFFFLHLRILLSLLL